MEGASIFFIGAVGASIGLALGVLLTLLAYRTREGKQKVNRCANCGADLEQFPALSPNQRCPTKEEIKRGHYS